jgi:hypothetical protein
MVLNRLHYAFLTNVCVWVWVFMYIHECVCVCVYVCVYMCMCVCMFVFVCVCANVCMSVCMYYHFLIVYKTVVSVGLCTLHCMIIRAASGVAQWKIASNSQPLSLDDVAHSNVSCFP